MQEIYHGEISGFTKTFYSFEKRSKGLIILSGNFGTVFIYFVEKLDMEENRFIPEEKRFIIFFPKEDWAMVERMLHDEKKLYFTYHSESKTGSVSQVPLNPGN